MVKAFNVTTVLSKFPTIQYVIFYDSKLVDTTMVELTKNFIIGLISADTNVTRFCLLCTNLSLGPIKTLDVLFLCPIERKRRFNTCQLEAIC